MQETFRKLVELSDFWIERFEEDARCENPLYCDFYKWWETYFNWIYDELSEAKEEIKLDNSVYLEDELWDIFWDYLCLLQSLQKRWYIKDVKNVFERSHKKLNERIEARKNEEKYAYSTWQKVKAKQKKELLDEHNSLYGK